MDTIGCFPRAYAYAYSTESVSRPNTTVTTGAPFRVVNEQDRLIRESSQRMGSMRRQEAVDSVPAHGLRCPMEQALAPAVIVTCCTVQYGAEEQQRCVSSQVDQGRVGQSSPLTPTGSRPSTHSSPALPRPITSTNPVSQLPSLVIPTTTSATHSSPAFSGPTSAAQVSSPLTPASRPASTHSSPACPGATNPAHVSSPLTPASRRNNTHSSPSSPAPRVARSTTNPADLMPSAINPARSPAMITAAASGTCSPTNVANSAGMNPSTTAPCDVMRSGDVEPVRSGDRQQWMEFSESTLELSASDGPTRIEDTRRNPISPGSVKRARSPDPDEVTSQEKNTQKAKRTAVGNKTNEKATRTQRSGPSRGHTNRASAAHPAEAPAARRRSAAMRHIMRQKSAAKSVASPVAGTPGHPPQTAPSVPQLVILPEPIQLLSSIPVRPTTRQTSGSRLSPQGVEPAHQNAGINTTRKLSSAPMEFTRLPSQSSSAPAPLPTPSAGPTSAAPACMLPSRMHLQTHPSMGDASQTTVSEMRATPHWNQVSGAATRVPFEPAAHAVPHYLSPHAVPHSPSAQAVPRSPPGACSLQHEVRNIAPAGQTPRDDHAFVYPATHSPIAEPFNAWTGITSYGSQNLPPLVVPPTTTMPVGPMHGKFSHGTVSSVQPPVQRPSTADRYGSSPCIGRTLPVIPDPGTQPQAEVYTPTCQTREMDQGPPGPIPAPGDDIFKELDSLNDPFSLSLDGISTLIKEVDEDMAASAVELSTRSASHGCTDVTDPRGEALAARNGTWEEVTQNTASDYSTPCAADYSTPCAADGNAGVTALCDGVAAGWMDIRSASSSDQSACRHSSVTSGSGNAVGTGNGQGADEWENSELGKAIELHWQAVTGNGQGAAGWANSGSESSGVATGHSPWAANQGAYSAANSAAESWAQQRYDMGYDGNVFKHPEAHDELNSAPDGNMMDIDWVYDCSGARFEEWEVDSASSVGSLPDLKYLESLSFTDLLPSCQADAGHNCLHDLDAEIAKTNYRRMLEQYDMTHRLG